MTSAPMTGAREQRRAGASGARAVQACALAACALAGGPGCSFLFVDGPPPNHATSVDPIDCTQSRAAPIIDTIFAGLYGLSAVSTATEHGSASGTGSRAALMLGVAAVELASAAHGYANTADCREAKQRWAERRIAEAPGAACGSDLDCRDDRVCEAGACVAPVPDLVAPAAEAP